MYHSSTPGTHVWMHPKIYRQCQSQFRYVPSLHIPCFNLSWVAQAQVCTGTRLWYKVCCSSAGLLCATGGWLCNLLAAHVDADGMCRLSTSSQGTLSGLLASLTFCCISLPAQPYLVLSAGPFQPTAKLHASGYVLEVLHLIICGCNHHQPGYAGCP